MTHDHSIPPSRDLPPGRLAGRLEHLLAEIADAPRRPARASRRALPALATVAVAVTVLLLVSPWQGAPSLTERALAAIGDKAVLHVVTEQPDWFPPPIDIATGREIERTIRTEIWFDEERGLKKTVTRLGGILIDDLLETPAGGFTRGGPLITCAWIAAHPVEATRRRVSCNENMENGTTPRQIPEKLPTMEPTLSGFVDSYRSALGSGQAKEIGAGTIDGRDVIWIRFAPPLAPRPQHVPPPSPTDVAVDAATYRPVRIRFGDKRRSDMKITVAETLRYEPGLFNRPAQSPPGASFGRVREAEPIELADAGQLLARPPLWLGEEWHGFRLVEVRRLESYTAYGRRSGREPTVVDAVLLKYAAGTDDTTEGPTVEISEAATCQFGLRWQCGPRDPDEGQIRQEYFVGFASAKLDGLYLSITATPHSTEVDSLALVRDLKPVSP